MLSLSIMSTLRELISLPFYNILALQISTFTHIKSHFNSTGQSYSYFKLYFLYFKFSLEEIKYTLHLSDFFPSSSYCSPILHHRILNNTLFYLSLSTLHIKLLSLNKPLLVYSFSTTIKGYSYTDAQEYIFISSYA